MRQSWIEQIREAVRQARYDMTAHATQEMAEDGLDIVDVEQAILTGFVKRIERQDPRGKKFVIVGTATDGTTPVGVVGRFSLENWFLIITVYKTGADSVN